MVQAKTVVLVFRVVTARSMDGLLRHEAQLGRRRDWSGMEDPEENRRYTVGEKRRE